MLPRVEAAARRPQDDLRLSPLLLGALSADRGECDVGLAGIEPATSALSVLRSNRLSYSPGAGRRYTTAAGYPAGVLRVIGRLEFVASVRKFYISVYF